MNQNAQPAPEKLIERALMFLHEMKQLDKLIELRGYRSVIEMNPDQMGQA